MLIPAKKTMAAKCVHRSQRSAAESHAVGSGPLSCLIIATTTGFQLCGKIPTDLQKFDCRCFTLHGTTCRAARKPRQGEMINSTICCAPFTSCGNSSSGLIFSQVLTPLNFAEGETVVIQGEEGNAMSGHVHCGFNCIVASTNGGCARQVLCRFW